MNPSTNDSFNNYLRIYGGDYDAYMNDLNNLINRAPGYYDTALFDVIPFVISDIYRRPILIWTSYVNSIPTLALGPQMQNSDNLNSEILQIAQNAAENHYYNIQPIASTVCTISKPPRKKRKLNINTKNVVKHEHLNDVKSKHSIGMVKNTNNFMNANNILTKNKWDNNKFLEILYFCLLTFKHEERYIFRSFTSHKLS